MILERWGIVRRPRDLQIIEPWLPPTTTSPQVAPNLIPDSGSTGSSSGFADSAAENSPSPPPPSTIRKAPPRFMHMNCPGPFNIEARTLPFQSLKDSWEKNCQDVKHFLMVWVVRAIIVFILIQKKKKQKRISNWWILFVTIKEKKKRKEKRRSCRWSRKKQRVKWIDLMVLVVALLILLLLVLPLMAQTVTQTTTVTMFQQEW